jgi:hypothetical protein
VVDDYRFINEYRQLKDVNKLAIKIINNKVNNHIHQSENGILYQDILVDIGDENHVQWEHVEKYIMDFLK